MNKQQLAITILMSAVMGLCISGFFAFYHLGFVSSSLIAWGKDFILAWPLAFVLTLIVESPIKRIVVKYIPEQ
jgi:hypothetical protein